VELLRLRGIHDLHGGLAAGEGAFTSELGCVCIPGLRGCVPELSLSGLKVGLEFLDVLAHLRRCTLQVCRRCRFKGHHVEGHLFHRLLRAAAVLDVPERITLGREALCTCAGKPKR